MKLPANKLTYQLDLDGYGTYDPTPLNESSLVISWTLSNEDDNPRFAYDIKADGSLVFAGADFNWLYARETDGYRCAEMLLKMYMPGCGGAEILPGTKIRLSDGHWDLDKCQVTFPVICPDPYECLNLYKVDKLNIFDAAGAGPTPVELYDYVPLFEYWESHEPASGFSFPFAAQTFQWFPNRRCEFPLFGCEGEERDAFNPESGSVLFASIDLSERTRNPVDYHELLSVGSNPYHDSYPYFNGAYDAAAVGWRLSSFRYDIIGEKDTGSGAETMAYWAWFKWCREYVWVLAGTPMTPDWIYIETFAGADKYARPPKMVPRKRKVHPFTVPPAPSIPLEDNYIYYIYSNYVIGETTNIVEPNEDQHGLDGWKNVYGLKHIPNGIPLNDVIVQAVAHCCPGLTVKSEFFQINPDTVTSTNPVTGQPTYTDQILMFQKSDVKRPWATEPATVGTYTPEELFKWLWYQFQVKYCIFGNDFRLEHISSGYFLYPGAIDLSVPPLNAMLAGKRQYTYDIDNLPAKEMFSFQEAREIVTFTPNDDFAGLPITYDGFCVNRKEKENIFSRDMKRVTNDVYFILLNSGGSETQVVDNKTNNAYKVTSDVKKGVIADDGFTFIATRDIGGGLRGGVTAPTILNTTDIYNNVMGFALLHANFYMSDRNASTGTMNGVTTSFDSVKFIKRQVRLPFKLCCVASFNPHEYINTALAATGCVKRAEWKPTDQIMRVDLIFRI
jgi:hypothetical protein